MDTANLLQIMDVTDYISPRVNKKYESNYSPTRYDWADKKYSP